MNRRILKFAEDETGAAAVEAAIVMPVLLFLAFGTIEFSNAYWDHQLISTGVRDAARYLARVNDPTDGAAQARAQNIAVHGNASGTGPLRVTGFTTVTVAPVPIGNAARTYRGPNPIYIVTVSTTTTYQQFGMLTALGLTPPTFTISHSERSIPEYLP
jgi:Flp pilus assembly protein TadG